MVAKAKLSAAEFKAQLKARDLLDWALGVAKKHHVTLEEIPSRDRRKSVVAARSEFCEGLHARGLSWPQIGSLLNRDHTTAIAYVRKKVGEDTPVCERIAHWLDAKGEQALAASVRAGEWRSDASR